MQLVVDLNRTAGQIDGLGNRGVGIFKSKGVHCDIDDFHQPPIDQ